MSAYRSSLFRSLKKEVSEKLPQVAASQRNTARRLGVGYLSDLRSVGSLLGPLRLLEARGTSVDSDPCEAQTGWEECLAHSEPWDGSPLLAPGHACLQNCSFCPVIKYCGMGLVSVKPIRESG